MKLFTLLLSMAISIPASAATGTLRASPDAIYTGFRLPPRVIAGGSPVRISTDPIWVKEYSQLVFVYKLHGAPVGSNAILSLRPGSVGPVTPRATNPENPFANGSIVPVISASDLIPDGNEHRLAIDISAKIHTAQIDQLIFTLGAKATLQMLDLKFVAKATDFPCETWSQASPEIAGPKLAASGGIPCGLATATSLRGRESLTLNARGTHGSAAYLSMLFYSPALSNYVASKPVITAESSDPSLAVVRIHYADGTDDQFPLNVRLKRHVLMNGSPELYAVPLDPKRTLISLEIQDKSPHIQLFFFGGGVTNEPLPTAKDEAAIEKPSSSASRPLKFSKDVLFEINAGKTGESIQSAKPEFHAQETDRGRKLSLSVKNDGDKPLDLVVEFPSASIHSDNAHDVYYLLPQKSAIISADPIYVSAEYGPEFLLQFLDLFSPAANSGIALLVEDTTGQDKTFTLQKRGADIHVQVQYAVHLVPGETFTAPSVELVRHNGDWRQGFDAYRKWVATWYAPNGTSPAWLTSSFYARRDYPVGGSDLLFDEPGNHYTFDKLLADDQQAFGGTDFIDISGWALSGNLGRVGDYPIELGSTENLRNNIALAHSRGVKTGLYFEGYLVDKNSRIGTQKGAEWQIKDASGKGLWWPGGSPEMFLSPFVPEWRQYLSHRMAAVAKETGADGVYLDEFGCGKRRDYAPGHGPVGSTMIRGEIAMAKDVRSALNQSGQQNTILYAECLPVDVAAPYYDALFSYALPASTDTAYGAKLNLWRFAFPGVRLWDMLTAGVEPHVLSGEDFRLAFWHGDGIWLKGRTNTWYGADILNLLKSNRSFMLRHAKAFSTTADPLVPSPDDRVLVNRFSGGGDTVYTLFNRSYGSVAISFLGRRIVLLPRDVKLIASHPEAFHRK